ncbi:MULTISPECIES: hypothetical protein [unclassified Streptomyces]|uniref:hypothetical protein n=1 Tax=unclassified Streptomyces TaxID=2593676 RepID=UPI000490403A|nr:hypothetical protein [Streptomyces sp. DpondAA-D4]MYY15868.1 hypothetical protein [Streptomyces sp. SID4912]SCE04383.1 hypothetical protein GA0115241_109297 [Streptomyces sp. DpondAA-D4]
MGIESDQLVYDYLSRVGDLAQQQQLSSGARMRLVSTLRGEIDRQRGGEAADSPATVRRILGRLGAPDELVAAAAESGDGTVVTPSPRAAAADPEPARPRGVPRPRLGMFRKDPGRADRADGDAGREDPAAPAVRPVEAAGEGTAGTPPDTASAAPDTEEAGTAWPSASAPHMLGLGQSGVSEGVSTGEPEWWRIEPGPFGETAGPAGVSGAPDMSVPGFVGGLAPELLRRPRPPEEPADAPDTAEAEEAAAEAAPAPARKWPRLRRRTPVADAPARRIRLSHPLLLLAAALLVAGAVMGSWLALAGGWVLAYSSRKFSRTEAKWVALGLPGVVVAGAVVWLWGRMDGRWGTPIAEGALGDAMADVWPGVVRTAAVASAVYLVWRSRRLPG